MSSSLISKAPPPSEVLALASQLMSCRSIAPVDDGAHDLIAERLAGLGCSVLRKDAPAPAMWAVRGTEGPLFVFSGHTDVVPPGDDSAWSSPPFTPTVRSDVLYARGAVDMKGAVAAMIVAAENYLRKIPEPPFRLGFLLTGDEEANSLSLVELLRELKQLGVQIDFALVGEPTSVEQLGDMLKTGRRGSLSISLEVQGLQGHTAYPHRVRNPVHIFAPLLSELLTADWDGPDGDRTFEPTAIQVTRLVSDSGATNVVPAKLSFRANWRFRPPTTPQTIEARVREMLARHGVDYSLEMDIVALPFSSAGGRLVEWVSEAVRHVTGREPERSTSGGTSDARLIAPTGADVTEFGLINATMHKVDECVPVQDLEQLCQVYERVLENVAAAVGK